ncbi:TPA: hypothetical protein N0F65_005178 [Lagenidium giganteum]|uniref:Diaminopimelate decarboxylase n=1 Tax=Lagenidium giganteum TaxID=4803 RepID=A0AAV2Z1U2_9STRA|nr:TPA: hypothetical protein N0F65_005178 [Lagenidium giganteum]
MEMLKTVLSALHGRDTNASQYLAPALHQQEATADQRAQHQARAAVVSPVVQAIVEQRVVHDGNPLVNLTDWDAYTRRLQNLRDAFHEPEFNHAVAVKCNPIRGVLREAQRRGFGAECASFAEAKHALSLGFAPRKVVYDSPCKTKGELQELLLDGVYINLDNEQEIFKLNTIFAELYGSSEAEEMEKHKLQIGLRINPVVGGGTIAATSTATVTSKFGMPLTADTSERLFSIYQNNPWLQGVHVHVGSQGCPIDLLVAGAKRAVSFAKATNSRLGRQHIQVIDIGGGMPTLYDGGDKEAYDFHEYSEALRTQVPELFASGFASVITEFGRSIFVKPGITVSKVEALKDWAGQQIAVIHVGADQFPRTAYLPELWSHCITVLGRDGKVKPDSTEFRKQDVAGPLCFSGDFMAKQVLLPTIEVGDWLVIHDSGGYTTSMFSKYNSRQAASMFAYAKQAEGGYRFDLLKERESATETLAFWGIDKIVSL